MIACDCFPGSKHDDTTCNLVNFELIVYIVQNNNINDLAKSDPVLTSKTEVKISYPILAIAQTNLADKKERICVVVMFVF